MTHVLCGRAPASKCSFFVFLNIFASHNPLILAMSKSFELSKTQVNNKTQSQRAKKLIFYTIIFDMFFKVQTLPQNLDFLIC